MVNRRRYLREKTRRIVLQLNHYLGVPIPSKRKAKPLEMLIATILSQNTNDPNSHRAYANLRQTFPSWEILASAPIKKIASTIRTGGMATPKSVRIKNILNIIQKSRGSITLDFLKKKSNEEVFEILLSLDGVGLKTAACVLLFSLGRDIFPVDTHIHRICDRLGLTSNCKTPEQTFEWMKELVPLGASYKFHTNLIRFGRKICKANRPLCNACPIYYECKYIHKGQYRNEKVLAESKKEYDFMLLDNV